MEEDEEEAKSYKILDYDIKFLHKEELFEIKKQSKFYNYQPQQTRFSGIQAQSKDLTDI